MRLLMARLLTDNTARGVSIEVDDAGTIGHQATVVDAVPLAVHRRQARLRGERSDVRSLGREHRILEQDQRLHTALDHPGKCLVEHGCIRNDKNVARL